MGELAQSTLWLEQDVHRLQMSPKFQPKLLIDV